MCDGKMEKGTVSTVAAIVCGCDRNGKMERGRKAQQAWWLRSRWQDGEGGEGHREHGGCNCAAIAMTRWRETRRCGAREIKTKIRGDGIFQFLLHT